MGAKKNLVGQRFGRLVVIEESPERRDGRVMWMCVCDCGNVVTTSSHGLISGNTKSCGCSRKETNHKRLTTHGKRHERLYTIWASMKDRCTNPRNKRYENYGGRGIEVCGDWQNDFQAFYDWAISSGYTEGLTIDRIDNDGNYCPGNCRWATDTQQANNRTNNRMISAFGETRTLSEWSKATGLKRESIRDRIDKLGWDAEKALSTPTRSVQYG